VRAGGGVGRGGPWGGGGRIGGRLLKVTGAADVGDPLAEAFEEGSGDADGADDRFTQVLLGREFEEPVLEAREGDGEGGADDAGGVSSSVGVAGGAAGVGVEAGGNVDGEDGEAACGEDVDLIDEECG